MSPPRTFACTGRFPAAAENDFLEQQVGLGTVPPHPDRGICIVSYAIHGFPAPIAWEISPDSKVKLMRASRTGPPSMASCQPNAARSQTSAAAGEAEATNGIAWRSISTRPHPTVEWGCYHKIPHRLTSMHSHRLRHHSTPKGRSPRPQDRPATSSAFSQGKRPAPASERPPQNIPTSLVSLRAITSSGRKKSATSGPVAPGA